MRKRTLALAESAVGQKKVKIEEHDEKDESPTFGTSVGTVEPDGNSNKDEDCNNFNIIGAFKSYQDIYNQPGNHSLRKEYALAAYKALKLTVDYPDTLHQFNIAPALPPFILKDRKGRKALEKKLLDHIRDRQLRDRAYYVIDLALPKLDQLRKKGLKFKRENMIPIFWDVLKTSRWSSNIPQPSFICKFATPQVIALVLGGEFEETATAARFKKCNLPHKSKLSHRASRRPNAVTKARNVPKLQKNVTERAYQKTDLDVVSVGSSNLETSSHGLATSLVSSEQNDLLEQILVKIDRIPDIGWERIIANSRRERSIRRLNELLRTTGDLPVEEQLAFINRAVTE